MTSDEEATLRARYHQLVVELLARFRLPVEVRCVEVISSDEHVGWSASPLLKVTISFWGGGGSITITQQALDTTLGGTAFMAGFDQAAEALSQRALNTAAYKRIDAIIEPTKALVQWARTLRRAQQSSGLTVLKQVEDAIASEHAIRSAASATPVAADAASSVSPHEA